MHVSRRKLSVGLAVITAVLVAGAFISPLAHAASCGGVDTAIISCDASANPVLEIVKIVLRVMIGLVGVAAVGALIFAGIIYSSAGGEQAKVQKAKTMIQDTVIGIVLFGTMFIIGNFFIPNGIFGGDVTSGSVVSGGGSGSSSSGSTDSGDKLTLASWNVLKYDNSKKNLYAGIKEIFSKGADVIGLQEVDSPSFDINSLSDLASDSIGVYFPRGTTPIVWNKGTLTLLSSKNFQPLSSQSKYFPYLRFKIIGSDSTFYVMNVHMQTGVSGESSGCSTTACDNYKKQISAVSDKLKTLQESKIPTFVLGDFNVDYRNKNACSITWWPCSKLKEIAMKSSYESLSLSGIPSSGSTVSSGDKLIDHIFYWTNSANKTTALSQEIISPNATCTTSNQTDIDGDKVVHCWNGSDHKPVLLTVTVVN